MIYNLLKIIAPNMENQHRNLTCFLAGVIIYTLIYSYMGVFAKETNNMFLLSFFYNMWYILLADAFAMAVLYKNYYNKTIFTEVDETFSLHKDNIENGMKDNIERMKKKPKKDKTDKTDDSILKLDYKKNNEDDGMEGFVKDSALGDNWTTHNSE